jgi:hypothetical protein
MNRFIFLFILFEASSGVLPAQTNRALLVAIDKYPEASGWTDIHATNDVDILLPALMQNGYKQENINMLLNKEATKEAIIKALQTIVSQSGAGDYIYIHFSCHGQQMIDDNGDEPDGLDEALIPYDALRRFTRGKYEGENHLRDDELENYLEKLRKKITSSGNITVALDACHSGTGSRESDDDEYVRGTSYIFAPDSCEIPDSRPDNRKFHHKKDRHLSAITVFGACQAGEINYEYKDTLRNTYCGALSLTLCRIIKNDSGRLSIGRSATKLKKEMNGLFANKKRKQTPYFESTDENNLFKIGR